MAIDKIYCKRGHNRVIVGKRADGACIECSRENVRKHLAFMPTEKRLLRYRKCDLKMKYGLSIEEYTKLFNDQNGCCAICGRSQQEFTRRLAIDHDHTTNKNRGLLCVLCNTNLAVLENKEFCLKASLYLRGD